MIIFLSSLKFLPDPYHLSTYPPSCFSISFSKKAKPRLRNKKIKSEKSTHKQTSKQTKTTATIAYPMESVLCWLATPGHEACPWVWLTYTVTFHWRKPVLLFPVGIIATWLGIGYCVYFLFSVLGFYSIGTHTGFVCVVIVSANSCVLALLCLEGAVSLEFCITTASYILSAFSSPGECSWKASPLKSLTCGSLCWL